MVFFVDVMGGFLERGLGKGGKRAKKILWGEQKNALFSILLTHTVKSSAL